MQIGCDRVTVWQIRSSQVLHINLCVASLLWFAEQYTPAALVQMTVFKAMQCCTLYYIQYYLQTHCCSLAWCHSSSAKLYLCPAALNEIDPASHNFKLLLRNVVSRVMDAIPSKLLNKELGVAPTAEVEEIPSDANQTRPGDQPESGDQVEKGSGSSDAQQAGQAQQAKQAGKDGDPEGEEEGRERLPLFSHKVMTFVQHLLNYKVGAHSNAVLPGTGSAVLVSCLHLAANASACLL